MRFGWMMRRNPAALDQAENRAMMRGLNPLAWAQYAGAELLAPPPVSRARELPAFFQPTRRRPRVRADESRAPGTSGRCSDLAGAIGSRHGEMSELDQEAEHLGRALFERHPTGVDSKLRPKRLLIRIADAGKVFDLARNRLLVEALHVAPYALLERRRDVDLHERSNGCPRAVARFTERADGGDQVTITAAVSSQQIQ